MQESTFNRFGGFPVDGGWIERGNSSERTIEQA
jgi:hypothetical protein